MKKILSGILSLCMILTLFSGCFNLPQRDYGPTDYSQNESSLEEGSSLDESAASNDDPYDINSILRAMPHYLSWTATDWDAASDDEKTMCGVCYGEYIRELMVDRDHMDGDEPLLLNDEAIEGYKEAVEMTFMGLSIASDTTTTLKEAVDAVIQGTLDTLVQGLLDSVVE